MFSGAKFSGDGTSETLESMAAELKGSGAAVYTVGTDINQSDNINAMEYAAFIQLHAKQFPGAKIFLYGYSYGGLVANEVAKRLDGIGISVEYMAIVDAAKGGKSSSINRTVSGNVKYTDNFYQTTPEFLTGSHGAPYTGVNQVNNYHMRVSHAAMDEATRNGVLRMMRMFMNYRKN
jgi:thioesterase domain-containing protein